MRTLSVSSTARARPHSESPFKAVPPEPGPAGPSHTHDAPRLRLSPSRPPRPTSCSSPGPSFSSLSRVSACGLTEYGYLLLFAFKEYLMHTSIYDSSRRYTLKKMSRSLALTA
jgi:hypothetical protein